MSFASIVRGWVIVYPDDPTPLETAAWNELEKYISKIFYRYPTCIPESCYHGEDAFLVCTRNIAFADRENYRPETMGEEEVYYSVDEHRIFFGGGSKRGILYSVYTFLEQEMGYRFYTDDLEYVEHKERYNIPCRTYRFAPKMFFRAAPYLEGSTQDCALFNRINARSFIPKEYGGYEEIGLGYAHTLHHFVPDSMFEEHPEYFPLIDGERRHNPDDQRCLTNPEVIARTIEMTKAYLRKHPDHKMIGISQEDTGDDAPVCMCENCRRINEREESNMGTQLYYVNAVADAIKDEFPDRYIETLAYRFTRKAPKYMRPRDNVVIMLCTIECCFSHPIGTCDCKGSRRYKLPVYGFAWEELTGNSDIKGDSMVRDLKDWAAISDKLLIWDYVTNFMHYLAPHPNLHVIGPNMKLFTENNAIGMFPLGGVGEHGTDLADLKSWLLAKMMWNPDFDVKAGIREFIGVYAGAGAPYVMEYLQALEDQVTKTNYHCHCYTTPDRTFYTEDFVEHAEQCFERALAEVKDDATILRIRRMQMPIRYIRLLLYPETFERAQLDVELDRFLADMRPLGVWSTHEGGNPRSSVQMMHNRVRYRIPDLKEPDISI